MAKTLKRIDLLFREVKDPHAQENFWRLKNILNDLTTSGTPGPTGPTGPAGPAGAPGPAATSTPKLVATFSTDVGTLPTHLLTISGASSVTQITDNLSATIPNGIFGVGFYKPSAVTIDVIFSGIIGGYVGFTTGLPLFISTAGIPTHTPPATGMVQQIGFAISTTEFFVSLMQPMRRS